VIRQRFRPGDLLPYWCLGQKSDWHCLYNLKNDPTEEEDLLGTKEEALMLDLLRTALTELEAPDEQLTRLGIG
jgi:hypothetical protein